MCTVVYENEHSMYSSLGWSPDCCSTWTGPFHYWCIWLSAVTWAPATVNIENSVYADGDSVYAETLKLCKHCFSVFVFDFPCYTWQQNILFCTFTESKHCWLLSLTSLKVFDFTITYLAVYSAAPPPLSSFCMWWTRAWKKRTSRPSESPCRCPSACSRPTHWWASSRSDAWFRFTSSAAKGWPRASCSGEPKTWTPSRSRWAEAWLCFPGFVNYANEMSRCKSRSRDL